MLIFDLFSYKKKNIFSLTQVRPDFLAFVTETLLLHFILHISPWALGKLSNLTQSNTVTE